MDKVRAGVVDRVRAADAAAGRAVDRVAAVGKEWVLVEIVSAQDAARLQHTNRVFPVMNRYARNVAAK